MCRAANGEAPPSLRAFKALRSMILSTLNVLQALSGTPSSPLGNGDTAAIAATITILDQEERRINAIFSGNTVVAAEAEAEAAAAEREAEVARVAISEAFAAAEAVRLAAAEEAAAAFAAAKAAAVVASNNTIDTPPEQDVKKKSISDASKNDTTSTTTTTTVTTNNNNNGITNNNEQIISDNNSVAVTTSLTPLVHDDSSNIKSTTPSIQAPTAKPTPIRETGFWGALYSLVQDESALD